MAKTWLLAGLAGGSLALAMTVPGAATAETLAYPTNGFERIDLSSGLSVEYTSGDTHSVTADFQRGGPDDVFVDVDGDTLIIKRRRTGIGWGNNGVRATFTVVSPRLDGLEATSGSSFRGSGIDADAFDLDVSSGASVKLAGRCGTLDVDISSGASVGAEDLSCADADIDASSGASLSAAISDSVTVDASSGASVRVTGSPSVRDIDRSSGASVNITPGAL